MKSFLSQMKSAFKIVFAFNTQNKIKIKEEKKNNPKRKCEWKLIGFNQSKVIFTSQKHIGHILNLYFLVGADFADSKTGRMEKHGVSISIWIFCVMYIIHNTRSNSIFVYPYLFRCVCVCIWNAVIERNVAHYWYWYGIN